MCAFLDSAGNKVYVTRRVNQVQLYQPVAGGGGADNRGAAPAPRAAPAPLAAPALAPLAAPAPAPAPRADVGVLERGRHTGPRCQDGSLDMRFAVNRGRDKYRD